MTTAAESPRAGDDGIEHLVDWLRDEQPTADEVAELLRWVGGQPWGEGRRAAFVELARALDQRTLVEALDRPDAARLGAIRLLTLRR